jgi:hypothetical protein
MAEMAKRQRKVQSKTDREAREQVELATRTISRLILLVSILLPPLTVCGIANIGGAFGWTTPQDLLLGVFTVSLLVVNAPLFLTMVVAVVILMLRKNQSLALSGVIFVVSILYSVFVGYSLLSPR